MCNAGTRISSSCPLYVANIFGGWKRHGCLEQMHGPYLKLGLLGRRSARAEPVPRITFANQARIVLVKTNSHTISEEAHFLSSLLDTVCFGIGASRLIKAIS